MHAMPVTFGEGDLGLGWPVGCGIGNIQSRRSLRRSLSAERGVMPALQVVLHALLLALGASLAAGLQTGSHAAPSKVQVLTDEDFDEKTSSSGDWLINIYAPW